MGSVKNNLVEFASEFAVDLIDLIEQNRRNSELFRGFLRMKINERYGEVGMQKCQVIFYRALIPEYNEIDIIKSLEIKVRFLNYNQLLRTF